MDESEKILYVYESPRSLTHKYNSSWHVYISTEIFFHQRLSYFFVCKDEHFTRNKLHLLFNHFFLGKEIYTTCHIGSIKSQNYSFVFQ